MGPSKTFARENCFMAGPKTYVIETTYSVKYTTKDPVPISQIVSSLISLEKLIRRTSPFIEKKYAGIEIYDFEVFVQSIESGSLSQNMFVRLACGGKENAEQVEQLLEGLVKNGSPVGILIALGVGVSVGYGLASLNSKATHTVDFANNTIINLGAEMELDAGGVRTILDGITDKKKLAREAVDFVRPAKNDPDATIESGPAPEATIPAAVISEAPEVYEPPTPQEREVMYSDTPIVVYASDRDKSESGWGGIVPGVVDQRKPFVLADSVDPVKLHGRTRLRADITVVERFQQSKNAYAPTKVVIRKIN
jgi:hypothetical protein